MQETDTNYTIRNVKKALELLEKLAESSEKIQLQTLADGIGYSRNKTFRLLATLLEKGLVERDSITGEYQLGARTIALGRKLADSSNLARHTREVLREPSDGSNLVTYAHPIMEKLARKHEEAVYMTVIKDNEVLFLNMVDCDQPIKTQPFIGRKFPFFTNAAGKVMKAVDSWDLLERICRRDDGRERQLDLEKLASELQEIRATGVAVDDGGLGDGVISVAVAVRDYAGKVIGAITLLAPSFRMLAERVEHEIIPSLQEGASLLSARFGYLPA
ncbi:IclR family transcriptional regulator [Geomonas nitrogeniifigens]|uniref:IclR family transcriptional regulator n=1 Tax=Geomonas diazotrophica TaxID=2843197 RepID=A0ABX8JIK0_9BACT|nr:IclR family transcriptional regulator [Geomonas nitrogeniifigens]QWV96459.1 IclR family transcriptional regulator [Geomonas nitrogeniifigens]